MLGHVHVPCKSHNHMGTLCGIEHNASPFEIRGHKRASRDHRLPDAPDTFGAASAHPPADVLPQNTDYVVKATFARSKRGGGRNAMLEQDRPGEEKSGNTRADL